jgi:aspartate dehydrogenase
VRIGLIGCGAIGGVIVEASRTEGFADVVVVFDIVKERAEETSGGAYVAETFDEFIGVDMDVVVEAASPEAVRVFAEKVLEKADFLIMSVGALSDRDLLTKIESVAEKYGKKVYLPSGAVSGLDALKSVSHLAEEVTLTTIKNPESLAGAPFFDVYGIKPEEIKKRKHLFTGNAREAVELFPQNVNVAAAVSLAGIGFDKTKVRIIADPELRTNIHEIKVKGSFGEILTVSNNLPFPKNPKTSYLAALSAVRTLKNIGDKIIVGT